MRVSTSILVSSLLPLALSASTFPSLTLLPNVTDLFNAPNVPLDVSTLPPPEPFSATFEDYVIVLSKYGRPVPLLYFLGVHVRCLREIWSVVAHSQNAYQPPEVRPLDGPSFAYRNEMFHLELRQASSAVVNWKYVELYLTLNLILDFGAKYGMREMDIEVVVDGIGAFGGFIRYNGPPETP